MLIAANLFSGGQETTARLLGDRRCGILGERPRAPAAPARRPRAASPPFVEETLRIESPLKGSVPAGQGPHDGRRRRRSRRAPRVFAHDRRRQPRPAPVRRPERVPPRPGQRPPAPRRSAPASTPAPARRSPGPRPAPPSSASSTACPTSGSRRRTTARPGPPLRVRPHLHAARSPGAAPRVRRRALIADARRAAIYLPGADDLVVETVTPRPGPRTATSSCASPRAACATPIRR